MNDLNQINKANQDSVTNTTIQAARAAGKFVVAKYEGLHLISHEEAGTREDVDLAVLRLKESAGFSERFEVLAPTAVAQPA
jgi:hypothetical protein